jgi:hypothetical protein
MAGRIKRVIEKIIKERSKGDPVLERTTEIKIILKGVNKARYTDSSEDDPAVLAKLKKIAEELGVEVNIT